MTGDFWVSIAFAVLFDVLKQPKLWAKVKPALRKLRAILNQLDLDEPLGLS